MAIFNSFTFDNENSLDSGIYITGEAAFNAPKRVVEMVNIPGRNGAIAIDEGRFENIPVKYPAGCFADNMADFAEKVANFRNILASRFTYKRLEDTYYPDEFRMGLYRSGLEVDVVNQARAGKFDIEFDCKPQRFLKSGEIPVEYTPGQTPSDEQTKTGSIVTFEAEEGTIISDIKADINPVQDLHGYDNPWAGGNGKNKLNCRASRLKTLNTGGSWNGNTYTFRGVTFTLQSADGDVVDAIVANGTASGGTGYLIIGSPTDWSMQEGSTYIFSNGANIGTAGFYNGSSSSNNNLSIQFTYSGWTNSSNVTIGIANGATANAVVFKPMIRLVSETGPTWEPYSNICPISGWDRVKVMRTGKNKLNCRVSRLKTLNTGGSWNGNTYTFRGITFTLQSADGDVVDAIVANGTASGGTGYLIIGSPTDWSMQEGSTYIFSNGANIGTAGFYNGSSSSNNNLSIQFTYSGWTNSSNVTIGIANGVTANAVVFKPMIRLVSETDATYEPYQGNTYTIDLNGTRYGGTPDVTSGVMLVDRAVVIYNGSENWIDHANSKRWYLGQTPAGWSWAKRENSICNIASYYDTSPSEVYGPYFCFGDSGIYFNKSSASQTLADFKSQLADTNAQVVYELATPITVQLTPTEVKALLGVNNVWADSGDITVKYGTNPYIIVNPTDFPSKPLLEVTGVGSFWLGDTQITITGTSGQIIYIDCETGECYKVTGGIISPANGLVTLNRLDFPKLASRINNIQLGSGISKVKITPRWWRL